MLDLLGHSTTIAELSAAAIPEERHNTQAADSGFVGSGSRLWSALILRSADIDKQSTGLKRFKLLASKKVRSRQHHQWRVPDSQRGNGVVALHGTPSKCQDRRPIEYHIARETTEDSKPEVKGRDCRRTRQPGRSRSMIDKNESPDCDGTMQRH